MKIYVAGGWFTPEQEKALTIVEDVVKQTNSNHFMPRHMNLGTEGVDWQKVFDSNIAHLDDCDIVVASTEGKDMGTLWECGYAYGKGKEIVYFTNGIPKPNLMLGFSGIICSTEEELHMYLVNGLLPEEIGDYE